MIRNRVFTLMAVALAAGCSASSTPATSDAGPTAGDDATAATDGAVTDASSTSDSAPDAAAPLDAANADGAALGGCAFGEPNDTRETATPVAVNAAYKGLCVSNVDGTSDLSDFYVVTAPADVAGGYVAFTIANVSSNGDVEAVVTSVADSAQMLDVNADSEGATITGWFTVSAGAQYRVEVKRFGGLPGAFTYDLQLAYTKTTDTYEPNNTRADAKVITLATPIQASASAASASAVLAAGDGDDWYKVTLAAGAATVKLTAAPADFQCEMSLFDPANADAFDSNADAVGANCQIDATNLVAGVYTLNVHSFTSFVRALQGAPPPSVTGSYTLAVTQ